MAAKAHILGFDCVVTDDEWTCSHNPRLARLLNSQIDDDDIGTHFPDRDLAIAEAAVKRWSGKITDEGPIPEYDEDREY